MRPYSRSLFGGVSRIQRDSYSNKNTQTRWWTVRKQAFDRDGGVCASINGGIRCGAPAKEVHHVVPLSRGGITALPNLISLCSRCHDLRHKHRRG